jgi:hypothetical protein
VHMTNIGGTKEYGSPPMSWTGPELDAVDEFNSGIVVARADVYMDVLASVVASQTKVDPPKFEYYATDFVKAMVARDIVAEGWKVPTEEQWKLEGANTLDELKELEAKQETRRNISDKNRQGRDPSELATENGKQVPGHDEQPTTTEACVAVEAPVSAERDPAMPSAPADTVDEPESKKQKVDGPR